VAIWIKQATHSPARANHTDELAPLGIALSVLVAMVLAALFLGEVVTWRHWIGAGLIVAGTVIIAKA
jgi:drug/metabolite transporter (DMT)-like permease